MLQPKYTMHGFNWFDTRGTEGVGFVRALRTHLTGNLPQVLPDLGVIIRTRFAELHYSHSMIDGAQSSHCQYMIASDIASRKKAVTSLSYDHQARCIVERCVILW
jgi:hypothetical protein